MLVKSITEEEIYGIGHAFGYYDCGEETGMSAAFSGKEAVFWAVHPIQPDLPCDPAGRVVLAPLSAVSGSAMNIFSCCPANTTHFAISFMRQKGSSVT